jgi:Tol biopolymer transport system component
MSVKGGVLQTICHVRDFVWGTWGKDGWIVYGCTSGPLMRVREGGGIPEPATQLDTLRHETTHGYPEFLPDGKHFTYVTDPPLEPSSVQVRVGSVDGKQGRNLMAVQHAPQCDGRGWLVYMRDRSLLAQRVDASGRKLIGNPVPMLEVPERQGESSDPIVSVGAGVLAYVSEDSRSIGVEWYSRDGKVMSHVMDAMPHTVAPAIAPDGRHVALRRVQGGETWLTSIDLVTKAEIRLTDPERWSSWPIWDAAGNDILFSSTPSGAPMTGEFQIRSMAPDTPDSSRLLATSVPFVCPDAVSQDGRWLIERHETPRMQNDLILLDRERGWAERPLVATPANESCGAILAGGTKLAFMSDVTGRDELYLDDFPQRHKALRLTSDGCGMSVFNRHRFWAAGDALYYLALDACSLHELRLSHAGGRWRAAEDRALFTLPINYHGMCPAPDGSRFLVLRPDGRRPEPALTVVLNWQHGLNSP